MKVLIGTALLFLFLGTTIAFPAEEELKKNETTVFGTIETNDEANARISPILVEPTDELNATTLPIPFQPIDEHNATTLEMPIQSSTEHKHVPHKCPHRSHISPMDVIKDIKAQLPAPNDTAIEHVVRNIKENVEMSDLESPKTLLMEGESMEKEIVRAVPEFEALSGLVIAEQNNTTNTTTNESHVKAGRSADPETKSEVGTHNLKISEIEEKLKASILNQKSIREVLETVIGENKTDHIMPAHDDSVREKRSVSQTSGAKSIGIKNPNPPSKFKKSHLKFKRSASYSDAPVRSSSYNSPTRSADQKYAVRTKPVKTTRSGYGGARSFTRSSYGPTRSVPVPEDIKISLATEVRTPGYSTTREIEEVRSGYQTVREIPEIRTTYETVREVPAVRVSNYETVRTVPAVRSNYDTVREAPAVRSNYETVREAPAVRSNYDTVRSNYETVRQVPVLVREVPQVKTIIREVPVVRTIVKEVPTVKTTYTETRSTPEIRTTYVPTRSAYGTQARKVPETRFNYNAPDTRSTYTATREVPEVKTSYETVRAIPEIKSTYETVRSVPEIKTAYETVRTVPETKTTYETVRTVPQTQTTYETVRAIPETKTTYETVRAIPETKTVYTTVREAPKVRTTSYTTGVRSVPELVSVDYFDDLSDLPVSQDWPVIPVLGNDDDRYKRSPAPRADEKDKKKRHFSSRHSSSHVASRAATRVDMPFSF